MSIKTRTKKALVLLLKRAKKQFYDEEGQPITVEQFADKLMGMDLDEARELEKHIKAKQEQEKAQVKSDEQSNQTDIKE